MGFVFVFGECCACRVAFTFNPERVPSIRGRWEYVDFQDLKTPSVRAFVPDKNGEREPVCRPCFEKFNRIRKERGLFELPLLPGAYEPAEVA